MDTLFNHHHMPPLQLVMNWIFILLFVLFFGWLFITLYRRDKNK